MDRTFNVAVIGATGLVGEAVLEMLEQREFPVGNLYLLSGEESVGKSVSFRGKVCRIRALDGFDFAQAEIAFFAASAEVAQQFAPLAADAGCVVVDGSEGFRYEPDVPLVVAEVNPEMVGEYRSRGIIASPDSAVVQMLIALAPVHRNAGVERINVATYQAVSGSGRKGVEELASQTARLLNGLSVDPDVFAKQITFNVLPQVGRLLENGYSSDEIKLIVETQKVLGDESVRVNPTCVQVPVFFGYGAALHVETRDPASALDVREWLEQMPGVVLSDDAEGEYATPATEAVGQDEVYISRIREDISSVNGVNMWVVADNIRKGAALNLVQIAELLVRDYL